MKPFRSEIRNSPTRPTIKIYLSDSTLDITIKNALENFNGVEFIELRESVGRNRADENITIFIKNEASIHEVKEALDTHLQSYFNTLA